jgi:N-acetylglucosaminyldiphosphoundecaprenol N-acetyl-beta-D-mannosaminyltransferase
MTWSDSDVDFLGFRISLYEVEEIVELGLDSDNLSINCFNAHSYAVQKRDLRFADALKRTDVLLPDGSGVELFSKTITNHTIKKISGADLFLETFAKLDIVCGSVFLLGSSSLVLERMVERATKEFPNVRVGVLSPPYKNEFSQLDIDSFVNAASKNAPDVIFVGMTAPKQEIVIDMLPKIQGVKFLAGVGAVFDFYAGTITRPSNFWIKLHLEWLRRFLKQPKHLWRRVMISMPIFLWDLFLSIIKNIPSKFKRC